MLASALRRGLLEVVAAALNDDGFDGASAQVDGFGLGLPFLQRIEDDPRRADPLSAEPCGTLHGIVEEAGSLDQASVDRVGQRWRSLGIRLALIFRAALTRIEMDRGGALTHAMPLPFPFPGGADLATIRRPLHPRRLELTRRHLLRSGRRLDVRLFLDRIVRRHLDFVERFEDQPLNFIDQLLRAIRRADFGLDRRPQFGWDRGRSLLVGELRCPKATPQAQRCALSYLLLRLLEGIGASALRSSHGRDATLPPDRGRLLRDVMPRLTSPARLCGSGQSPLDGCGGTRSG